MYVLWKGRHQKADCKFKTATVGHLRTLCRKKDADEPSPEITVEEVWCVTVQDTVDDGHCDCIQKHDVISQHRDESKLEQSQEHRDESKFQEYHDVKKI